MTDSDTDYYLERARQEAVRAIQADHPSAAAVHKSLSARYSARAVIGIVNDQDNPRERARHRGLIATMKANLPTRG
jgi:hypothetical protein